MLIREAVSSDRSALFNTAELRQCFLVEEIMPPDEITLIPVHNWFLDPLGQRVVIGLGLGTATLLLIKSPLGEASGAHMNPAITLTFFYHHLVCCHTCDG